MKITDDAVLRDHYDVIVVGGGIGGLTASALLAKRGLDTLLLEQHYLPGGVCSAIRRHDIAMDVGAAILYGWGEEGMNPHRYVMGELEEEIDMILHESIYNWHFQDGKTVSLWHDKDRYLGELIAAFPNQEKGIRGFYAELTEFYDAVIASNEMSVPPTEIPLKEAVNLVIENPASLWKMGRLLLTT